MVTTYITKRPSNLKLYQTWSDPAQPNTMFEQLDSIIETVQIHKPDVLTFAGTEFTFSDDQYYYLSNPPNNPLLERLQNLLYGRCYCKNFTLDQGPNPRFNGMDYRLVRKLSQANHSRKLWDPGWEILRITSSDDLVISKEDDIRHLSSDIATSLGDEPPEVGNVISFLLDKESYSSLPGFYAIYGESRLDEYEDRDLLRIYFNLQIEGGAVMVSLVSRIFNRFKIPFMFKCPNHPDQYFRRDAGVLYIHKKDYRLSAELLESMYEDIMPHLKRDIPLFTKLLAPGIGLAEDPGPTTSFGYHRCWLLAKGFWASYIEGISSFDDRQRMIKRTFASHGIQLERPHLNPGSIDRYPILIRESSRL